MIRFGLVNILFALLSYQVKGQCPTATQIQNSNRTINAPDSCSVTANVNQGLWPGTQTLTINAGGILTIDGNLSIYDNVVVNGKLYVTGDFSVVAGQITVNPGGELIITGSILGIAGDMVIDGTMTVGGSFTNLGGDVTIDGDVTVDGDFFTAGGTVTVDGDMDVGGDFTNFGDSSDVGGDGTLDVDGTTNGDTGGLPVEWLTLDARAIDNMIEVTWSTAQEIGNDFFTIEKSVNGIDLQQIGSVKGAGYIVEPIDYSFIDKHPYFGRSYYRIRQTDFNGQTDVSWAVSAVYDPFSLNKKIGLRIYPNPAHDELLVNIISHQQPEKLHIQILDLNGRVFLNDVISIEREHTFSLDLRELNLSRGMYILKIQATGDFYTERLMIE